MERLFGLSLALRCRAPGSDDWRVRVSDGRRVPCGCSGIGILADLPGLLSNNDRADSASRRNDRFEVLGMSRVPGLPRNQGASDEKRPSWPLVQ